MDEYVLSNVLPDKKDKRDYIFSKTENVLPTKYNYLEYIGQIENQLSTGSCVANSTVSSLETLALRNGFSLDFSRLFLYYNLRESYAELKDKDNGAYMRDGFKMVNKFGLPNEKTWPFVVANVNLKPDEKSYTEAEQNKVTSYNRILPDKDCITNIKTAVFNGFPTIFSLILDKSFYNMPNKFELQNYNGTSKKEDVIGSHAMHIIGYDDDLQSFYVENSWGSGWGQSGVFLLKYDVLLRDVGDIWTCTGFKDYKMDAKNEIKKPTFFQKVKNYFKEFSFVEFFKSKPMIVAYIILLVNLYMYFTI